MKSLNEFMNDSIDEALQIKVGKAVENAFKSHDDIAYLVIAPYTNEEIDAEMKALDAIGPTNTDNGRMFIIRK